MIYWQNGLIMDELWNLRNVHMFDGLTLDEINTVRQMMPIGNYGAGEYLFLTGEAADGLYILKAGTVKVSYITLNGDEKILNIFQPGDVFGDLFLGKYRHRIGQAQTLEDVIVCKLAESDFLDLIQRFPTIALNFIRHQADEHRETLARMHALMRVDAKHRLLGILLNLARRYCCEEGDWFTLHKTLTQEDLANMAGLNRSTVSSLVNDLRRQGILGGTGRSLMVNRAAIETMLENAGVEMLE